MMQHSKKCISKEHPCKKDKCKKRCKERESSLWYKQNSGTPRHSEKYAEMITKLYRKGKERIQHIKGKKGNCYGLNIVLLPKIHMLKS